VSEFLSSLPQYATVFGLIVARLMGFFLTMPLFAFRAFPITTRATLAFLLALSILPLAAGRLEEVQALDSNFFALFVELAIGLTIGFMVRLGFLAFDLLAEIVSVQAGLSFAAQFSRDPALLSGLTGEFIGMIILALAFAMNIHLAVLDLLIGSFSLLPFGSWVASWTPESMVLLASHAFVIGLTLTLPVLVVYLLFNVTQAVVVRVSPQMNLFAVGFAILVPLAYVVLALLLPVFPEALERALELPMSLIREGLAPAPL
jgi:flagellar biosynthesis protein FliR